MTRSRPPKGRTSPKKAVANPSSPWAAAPAGPLPRRSRRSSEGDGLRRVGGRSPGVVSDYEAASGHPMIPQVFDPAPNQTGRKNRFMQALVRHFYRNEAWVRNAVRVLVDVHIGMGPKPVSRFPERDKAIIKASRFFDHSGNRSWSGFLRDAYRAYILDGEVFIRRISHVGTDFGDSLPIPVTFQILTSEFVPFGYNKTIPGIGTFVNGVCRVAGRVTHYAVYSRHPGEAYEPGEGPIVVAHVPASELYHWRDAQPGSNRGDVFMASAILRIIKASTLEDAEVKRKLVAICMSVFVERPADDYDNFELPSEEECSEMIDAAVMSPGAVLELPYGYKANLVAPPDEGQNFEKSLRWLLMGVCAAIGMPMHEVIGDWNSVPERMVRYVGQSMERRAEIVHDDLEHQGLNPMLDDVVDIMVATDKWEPPADLEEDGDETRLEWPPLPLASFKQELAIMLLAKKEGILDASYIQKNLFAIDPRETARSRADEAARNKALGFVEEIPTWSGAVTEIAQRILDRALEAEEAELDLQDDEL